MINGESQVSRKTLNEDRIAICPQFGCRSLEKVKPLKFGLLGFRRYPKCSKHKIPLIFVDEFIGDFLCAVNACLFDFSSIPPKNLRHLIKTKFPNELIAFINGWMYCIPIGRGAQIVSQYMDGLSRAYMKLLSRKQRKALKNEKSSTKRYNMLRLALKKIAAEYTAFLQELRESSEILYDPENLHPLSKDMQKLLKKWLKDHLKTIKSLNSIAQSKSSIQENFLPVFKEEYDKILHAGTCALLLGKSPSIVTKAVSSFELFSAYHEFLKAGICKKITIADVKSLIEETQDSLNDKEEDLTVNQENEKKDFITELDNMNNDCEIRDGENVKILNINLLKFKEKVGNNLKKVLTSIKCTQKQKKIIWSKSIEMLDDLISRAENNEFSIPKQANLKKIAATIIYTVAISNKNMPKITQKQLGDIGKLYRRSKHLYPRMEFDISYYQGLKKIRNLIAFYFFELLRNSEIETLELVLQLKEKIQKNTLSEYLMQEQVDILNEMATQFKDAFNKYFYDLAEVVKLFIIHSKFLRKISATLMVQQLANFLEEKSINLFYKSRTFHVAMIEIYDYLRDKDSNFFPPRVTILENLSKKQRQEIYIANRIVLGNKIKLYVAEKIYDGLYFNEGRVECPKCVEEEFRINTYQTRATSLEFHHDNEGKESLYNTNSLVEMFQSNRRNPYFLEKLISKMQSDGVILLCRCHHVMEHRTPYSYFKYLINWENIPKKFPQEIFSLPAELIQILIKVSIDNFSETKNYKDYQKDNYKSIIRAYIKKRYIIEKFYGKKCHTCNEFNISRHLPAFDFHHNDGHHFHENPFIKNSKKIRSISDILVGSYTCSEIAHVLEYENGAYICANCHNVIGYSPTRLWLLNKIYNDKALVKNISDDHVLVKKRLKFYHYISSVKDFLKKDFDITDSFEIYLDVIYRISPQRHYFTHNILANVLKYSRQRVYEFFYNKKSFFKDFVRIDDSNRPKKYFLKRQGKIYIELIHYFRDYYKNL